MLSISMNVGLWIEETYFTEMLEMKFDAFCLEKKYLKSDKNLFG